MQDRKLISDKRHRRVTWREPNGKTADWNSRAAH